MSKSGQTIQSSASDFFARGRKATTTQRIVTAKKPLVNTPLPQNKACLPAPASPTIKPRDKHHLAETSFDDDGLDDDQFRDSDFEADDDEDKDEVQIVAVVKPVTPTITKIKTGQTTTSVGPRALTNITKIKEDALVRRAHSAGNLVEIPRTTPRKRSNAEVNTRSVSVVVESIHQEDLTETEKALRQFDLTSKYGPCTDITRLERWNRASLLGLKPPQEIKDMLLKNSGWDSNLFAGRV